jgi:two-component system cell cycle response regulator
MLDKEILDKIASGLCITDKNLTVLLWNYEMERMTDLPGHEISGQKLGDFFPLFKEESILLRLEMSLSTGAPLVFSSLLHRDLFKLNTMPDWDKYLEVTVNPHTVQNEKENFIFTVRDVTDLNRQIHKFREMKDKALAELELREATEIELKAANKKLQELADTDPLTGLLNRRSTQNLISQEFERYKRQKISFSVILADIDFFKKFNDTYGHDCGDEVLKEISRLLLGELRALDSVSRWGGEEFLILMPGTQKEKAAAVAEKLRLVISQAECDCKDPEETITMTFGVSGYIETDNMEILIKRADNALYRGKDQGRNCVVVGD